MSAGTPPERRGFGSPASRFSAVDLPQPDGPRKVTNSPPCTSSANSSSTVRVPKRFVRRNESAEITLEFLDPLRSHFLVPAVHRGDQDRKSTRLNSSHITISYAVFCLKKKNKKTVVHITRF